MPSVLDRQARELHDVVTELVRRYQFRDRHEICCHGISVSQCYTLQALAADGRMAMGDLADRMRLSVSTMTRVVDQLVAKRLVARHLDANDRRVCAIDLTEAGRALFETITGELIESEKAVLMTIRSSERATVVAALRELVKAIDAWRVRSRCRSEPGGSR
jgi:DNA-binding MarR family transcriptional regulator